MYTIKVHYQTGNSFNTEDDVEEIGLVWKDKNLARLCLQSIKEHYTLYKEMDNNHSGRSFEEILSEVKNKAWFNSTNVWGDDIRDRIDFHVSGLRAKMDDGTYRQVNTSMWCGYFERLYGAEVVCLQDDEDSFTI